MKISITLDIEPDEIGLANEIIATLRTLTTNVSINKGSAAKTGLEPTPSSSSVSSGTHRTPSPAAAPPPVSQPQTSAPAPSQPQRQPAPPQQPAQQPQPQPQPQPPAQPTPNGQPADFSWAAFDGLVTQLGDDKQFPQAAAEIGRLLGVGGMSAFETFIAAFMSAVITGADSVAAQQQSVAPYIRILASLPDSWKSKAKTKVIENVLKHLTIIRPVNVKRTEFFAQAEAFAALVQNDLIAINGTVQTIVTMMKKPGQRTAAITMLGKTCELCFEQLSEAPPDLLQKLRVGLHECTEPEFDYDLHYITEIMGWTLPDTNGAPPAAPQILRPVTSLSGHSDTIFALAPDAARNRIISGGKDSQILVWDDKRQRIGTPQLLDGCFICAADVLPRSELLFVGGVPKSKAVPGASCCILGYRMTDAGLSPLGSTKPSGIKLLSTLRALPDAEGFVTGETILPGEHLIRFYSALGLTSFDNLQAIATLKGHKDMVTAAAACPGNASMFVSGSKDGQVLLWDQRAGVSPAGRFATPPSADGKLNMITSLDASGHALLAGGTNAHVTQWDFRQVAQGGDTQSVRAVKLDDSTVLRLAVGPSLSAVAVASFHGLYLTDFSGAGVPGVEKASFFADGRQWKHYHDIAWLPGSGRLFAGGTSTTLDSYQLS